ncbi:hypothetical protein MSG28_012807 [Choristoneura fumiferana]|uniref:Uncharacterized protein n=1 Tax=Choristoneura fumiferana TaxID=7141 RepID=A0ACC0JIB0_CHOFU|nr:hypothetical protein MSG28_012807 [Choristoneura fumiferana]
MAYVAVFMYIAAMCLHFVELLNNGLALTPPMGWMSWGYYMCGVECETVPEKCLNEQLILSVADKFYREGYQEAGFEYIIIDDCWSERYRGKDGRLKPDRKRFPRGMKFLADYIHARGLKFGMYTNVGKDTCMRYPGSRGHFSTDAKAFAEWGVDYLKVDGCFVENTYLDTAYIKLGHHLNKTGRPMVFSCSWPYYKKFIHHTNADLEQVAHYCNLWRNYHDVVTHWPAIVGIMSYFRDQNNVIRQFHKPGQWNDPDMLILGTNSLTESQSRVQVAVYAMWSAPLLLSCNMNRIKPFEKQLLQNMDLIAIGQDALGIMATPYMLDDALTLWVKRRLPAKGNKYHTFSFALVNVGDYDAFASFSPSEYGADSTDIYTVMDVFSGVYLKNITRKTVLDVVIPPEALEKE